MKDIACFSQNVMTCFDNNYDNIAVFNDLMLDAGRGIYTKYSKEDTNKILREQFNKMLGIDYRNATVTQRRQAFRKYGVDCFSVIENTLLDRMISGINESNMPIMKLVEDRNIALGDINWFTVENKNAVLQVSKWASGHHDIDYYSVRIA